MRRSGWQEFFSPDIVSLAQCRRYSGAGRVSQGAGLKHNGIHEMKSYRAADRRSAALWHLFLLLSTANGRHFGRLQRVDERDQMLHGRRDPLAFPQQHLTVIGGDGNVHIQCCQTGILQVLGYGAFRKEREGSLVPQQQRDGVDVVDGDGGMDLQPCVGCQVLQGLAAVTGGLRGNQGIGKDLLQGKLFPGGQRVSAAGHEGHALLPPVAAGERVIGIQAGGNIDHIQVILFQHFRQLCGGSDPQKQIGFGVFGLEEGYKVDDCAEQQGLQNPDAQGNGGVLRLAFEIGCLLENVLNVIGVCEKVPSSICQIAFSPHPLEKGKPQFLFQRLYLRGYRGLGIFQILGGLGEVAHFRNVQKGSNITQIHNSSMISEKRKLFATRYYTKAGM